jgi:hypothetical protein
LARLKGQTIFVVLSLEALEAFWLLMQLVQLLLMVTLAATNHSGRAEVV